MNKPTFESQGLNDIVEVIDFVFTSIDTVKQAKENDGVINLKDLFLLFPLVESGSVAVDGIENIPAAFAAASPEDRDAIRLYFNERFDIPNDVTEERIEKALEAIVILYEVFFPNSL